jgi:hypothetical protein
VRTAPAKLCMMFPLSGLRSCALANSNSASAGAVLCSLANDWIASHVHRHHGDLCSHRPPGVDLGPSCPSGGVRAVIVESLLLKHQLLILSRSQKSPEPDGLESTALRYRCLHGVSKTPPKDCDWNQTVDAAALSLGADPAEIPIALTSIWG